LAPELFRSRSKRASSKDAPYSRVGRPRRALSRIGAAGTEVGSPRFTVTLDGHDMPEPKQSPRDLTQEAVVSSAEQVIPLAEETVRVDTRAIARGKVRIRTETDTVEEIARAALDTETVEITRVPIDREVDMPPAVRTENDVVIVPVLEEVLVIEKRLVLKEELHIRRRIATETIEQPVTLRKQRAVVEHLDPSDPEAPNSKEPPS